MTEFSNDLPYHHTRELQFFKNIKDQTNVGDAFYEEFQAGRQSLTMIQAGLVRKLAQLYEAEVWLQTAQDNCPENDCRAECTSCEQRTEIESPTESPCSESLSLQQQFHYIEELLAEEQSNSFIWLRSKRPERARSKSDRINHEKEKEASTRVHSRSDPSNNGHNSNEEAKKEEAEYSPRSAFTSHDSAQPLLDPTQHRPWAWFDNTLPHTVPTIPPKPMPVDQTYEAPEATTIDTPPANEATAIVSPTANPESLELNAEIITKKAPTQDCSICFSDTVNIELPCSHSFCVTCVITHIETCIKNFDVPLNIRCPILQCNAQLSSKLVNSLVKDKETIRLYDNRLRALKVAQNPTWRLCPALNCGEAVAPRIRNVSKWNIFKKVRQHEKLKCPRCHLEFCANCNGSWSKNCGKAKCKSSADLLSFEQKIQNYILDSMCKCCPQCGIITFKTEGCNHMTCSVCQSQWCWLCLSELNDTFDVFSHFSEGACDQFLSSVSIDVI